MYSTWVCLFCGVCAPFVVDVLTRPYRSTMGSITKAVIRPYGMDLVYKKCCSFRASIPTKKVDWFTVVYTFLFLAN